MSKEQKTAVKMFMVFSRHDVLPFNQPPLVFLQRMWTFSGCNVLWCSATTNFCYLRSTQVIDWQKKSAFPLFFCSLAPLLSVGRGIKADPISLRTPHSRTLERRFQVLKNQNKHSLTLNNTEEYLLCRRGFLCLIHLQLSVDLCDWEKTTACFVLGKPNFQRSPQGVELRGEGTWEGSPASRSPPLVPLLSYSVWFSWTLI